MCVFFNIIFNIVILIFYFSTRIKKLHGLLFENHSVILSQNQPQSSLCLGMTITQSPFWLSWLVLWFWWLQCSVPSVIVTSTGISQTSGYRCIIQSEGKATSSKMSSSRYGIRNPVKLMVPWSN